MRGPLNLLHEHERQSRGLPRLFINHMPDFDSLIALEFGRVDEGQPMDRWMGMSSQVGFLLDEENRVVGFKVHELSQIDLDSDEHALLWQPPHFCAPTLALTRASCAEVIVAAHRFYAGNPSLNRLYFTDAIDARGTKHEISEWVACLASGDCMGHFGLGVALLDSGGDPKFAYKHLRYYASIAPEEPWALYWFARAALLVGMYGEARIAAQQAWELAVDDDQMTVVERLADEIRAAQKARHEKKQKPHEDNPQDPGSDEKE